MAFIAIVRDLEQGCKSIPPVITHMSTEILRCAQNDNNGVVILSAAKNPCEADERFFAALRMTGSHLTFVLKPPTMGGKTQQ